MPTLSVVLVGKGRKPPGGEHTTTNDTSSDWEGSAAVWDSGDESEVDEIIDEEGVGGGGRATGGIPARDWTCSCGRQMSKEKKRCGSCRKVSRWLPFWQFV